MPSSKIKAGCIVRTRFVDKSISYSKKAVKAFSSYVDYVDRHEAIRNAAFTKFNLSSQYEKYNDYMGNPMKTGGLFTENLDTLNDEQKKCIKAAFKQGYDNDSIMWQTVVSFDNRFLTKLGIYDPETRTLDEERLRAAVRSMMAETLKQENMLNSAVWSAAIHYNTKHIHIHIAYTEPVCTRQRKVVDGKDRPKGHFSPKTFRAMKSKMVNHLLESEHSLTDKLMREVLIKGKKEHWTLDDADLRDLFLKIYDLMPEDKRLWFYNMNALKNIRPMIDELVHEYIMQNHAGDYAKLQVELTRQQEVYEEAYGRKSHANGYAKKKDGRLICPNGQCCSKGA